MRLTKVSDTQYADLESSSLGKTLRKGEKTSAELKDILSIISFDSRFFEQQNKDILDNLSYFIEHDSPKHSLFVNLSSELHKP